MNIADIDNAPRVTLGGKEWPVPMLAAKQNKIIDPLILKLLPCLPSGRPTGQRRWVSSGPSNIMPLLEIALVAIRRAHPELTYDEFMELPVTLPELIGAFSIIAQQTGVFTRSSPGDSSMGEA